MPVGVAVELAVGECCERAAPGASGCSYRAIAAMVDVLLARSPVLACPGEAVQLEWPSQLTSAVLGCCSVWRRAVLLLPPLTVL